MIPEMDGTEVLAAIREDESKRAVSSANSTKIVIMTGIEDPKVISQTYQTGCEAIVSKPVDRERLYQALRAIGIEIAK